MFAAVKPSFKQREWCWPEAIWIKQRQEWHLVLKILYRTSWQGQGAAVWVGKMPRYWEGDRSRTKSKQQFSNTAGTDTVEKAEKKVLNLRDGEQKNRPIQVHVPAWCWSGPSQIVPAAQFQLLQEELWQMQMSLYGPLSRTPAWIPEPDVMLLLGCKALHWHS